MAEHISTSIRVLKAILVNDTPTILSGMTRAPFTGVGTFFSGMMPSPPYAWVQPRSTEFDDETQVETQRDQVTVKIGISGSDPEAIAAAALDYVAAVDQAIRDAADAELDPTITHLHIQAHDYGLLYVDKGGFARYPEIHLEITRREVIA